MTLLEQLAKYIYERCGTRIFASWDKVSIERETFISKANEVLTLIQNHPETIERRYQDFQAGRCPKVPNGVSAPLPANWISQFQHVGFDDYLAAEKK